MAVVSRCGFFVAGHMRFSCDVSPFDTRMARLARPAGMGTLDAPFGVSRAPTTPVPRTTRMLTDRQSPWRHQPRRWRPEHYAQRPLSDGSGLLANRCVQSAGFFSSAAGPEPLGPFSPAQIRGRVVSGATPLPVHFSVLNGNGRCEPRTVGAQLLLAQHRRQPRHHRVAPRADR